MNEIRISVDTQTDMVSSMLTQAPAALGYVPDHHIVVISLCDIPGKPDGKQMGPVACAPLDCLTQAADVPQFMAIDRMLSAIAGQFLLEVTKAGLAAPDLVLIVVESDAIIRDNVTDMVAQSVKCNPRVEMMVFSVGQTDKIEEGATLILTAPDGTATTGTIGDPYTSILAAEENSERGLSVHPTRDEARAADPDNRRNIGTHGGW